jgi:hypothetical protein
VSAPETHDPLKVTTKDGMRWELRAVTESGSGMYALAGVCDCPEYVLASFAELAERGIVGPEPQASEVERLRAHSEFLMRDVLRLRARVAELEVERDALKGRLAELEDLTPAAIQTCRVCGAGYTLGEPCSTCAFQARMAAEVDGITRRIAPTQALGYEERAAAESDPGRRVAWRMLAADVADGEHYAVVHHDYRVSHDLPQTGGDHRG